MPVLKATRERNCGARKSCWQVVTLDLKMKKAGPWEELGLAMLDRKNTQVLGSDRTGLED